MNILLINNNQSFRSAVSASLKGQKQKVFVSEGIENALVDIQKHSIHIAIVNWSRGDFDIAALCRKIQKNRTNKYVHVMVVTTRDHEKYIEKFLEAGAGDFLFKPFGREEMRSRILLAERSIKLAEEASRNKKKMMKMAKEDPVTGLFNRRSLMDEMLKEMGRAAREMKYIATMMVSIINFKELGEIHGQAIMDEVLLECGRRMKSSCRPYDKLGRYTLSDFLLFIPDSGRSTAEKVARRIISSSAKKPIYVGDANIRLSLAIGISELDPKQISKNNTVDSNLLNDLILDSLIKRSEMAVKRAVRSGENKIEVFLE